LTPSLILIPKNGTKTADSMLALIGELGLTGTLFAADFYIEGAESWEPAPGGWLHQSGRIVNVDHHADDARMKRHVSSANLALERLGAAGGLAPDDVVAISHIDCDSILTAGLLTGRLEPHDRYGAAAVAADHTGAEDAIADLLQGLDAHWSRTRRGPADLGTIEYLFDCLDRLERGVELPDAFAREAQDHRLRARERAAQIAQTMTIERGVATAFLEDGEGPVEGELFLPHTPTASLVASTNPHRDHPGRWRWKVRLGGGAPSWMSLHDLGIRSFDGIFGGRWNAGSNNRPGREEQLPGSPLAPGDYHSRLVSALDARFLERAIEIAVDVHRGQRDKAGAPYILHPLRVMAACESTDAKIVGVLHDVVEDGEGWTFERLKGEGFSEQVIAGLEAVTKRPEDSPPRGASPLERDKAYFAFCTRAAADPLGREVKRADLMDNMDVTRLPEITEVDRERFRRYEKALELVQ